MPFLYVFLCIINLMGLYWSTYCSFALDADFRWKHRLLCPKHGAQLSICGKIAFVIMHKFVMVIYPIYLWYWGMKKHGYIICNFLVGYQKCFTLLLQEEDSVSDSTSSVIPYIQSHVNPRKKRKGNQTCEF